jgi:F0F1-type ATP synthase membrane subunit b/b'
VHDVRNFEVILWFCWSALWSEIRGFLDQRRNYFHEMQQVSNQNDKDEDEGWTET